MVYKNINTLLRKKINSAQYAIGEQMPSEKTLAACYNVSRNTIRKALDLLEKENLIDRKHGAGTWIKNKNFQSSTMQLNSFTEIARQEGKHPSSQLIKFELQAANDEIAKGLNIPLKAQVFYVKRLRYIDDVIMQLEETWLCAQRFPDLTVSHMKNSKYDFIEKECGVTIAGCFETIHPMMPTPEIAQLLHISQRDPIIKMYTQAMDSEGNPIDYSILYTNMFEFQMKYYIPRNKPALTHTNTE
ncbi:MAG: Mannosyl-D-glycerate transport/metabolism system repressor MngR [Candidatus Erwinia impunctatus]